MCEKTKWKEEKHSENEPIGEEEMMEYAHNKAIDKIITKLLQ